MTTSRMAAVACVAVAACVSPVDYGEPVDADAGVDGPNVVYGHDEDNDNVSDKPDLCPTVPDLAQADADGDGVGDACHPQPDRRNQIVFFASFGPSDGPWPWEGADWNITQDALAVDVLGGAGAAYHPNELSAPLLMIAEVRLVDQGPAAEVSLFAEYAADGGVGSECFVRHSPDDQSGVLGWSRVSGGVRDDVLTASTTVQAPVFEQGQLFRLSAEHGYTLVDGVPGGVRCRYTTSGGYTAAVTHATLRSGAGQLRLAARDARLQVESVIAYRMVY